MGTLESLWSAAIAKPQCAGINVRRIYLSAFVLCSTLATIGGIGQLPRLASLSQQAGTGVDVNLNAIAAAVIGGTSLFEWPVALIPRCSGSSSFRHLQRPDPAQPGSSLRYTITGGVLAIAVTADLSPVVPASATDAPDQTSRE